MCIRDRTYTTLAVAGSHGKTSTSTFLSTILELCTHNSSSITGGIIPIYNSNCHLENTKYLVAEVDESDGTINKYESDIGIINNIDFDHCDHFSNLSEVISSFKKFAKTLKDYLLILIVKPQEIIFILIVSGQTLLQKK